MFFVPLVDSFEGIKVAWSGKVLSELSLEICSIHGFKNSHFQGADQVQPFRRCSPHRYVTAKSKFRMWMVPMANGVALKSTISHQRMELKSESYDPEFAKTKAFGARPEEFSRSQLSIQTLAKNIIDLKKKLAAVTISHTSASNDSTSKRKYLVVVGINTAFTSRKRRDSVRATWMPQGEKRKKLEEEKGIIIRFVIGRSANPGSILNKMLDDEEREHGDFLRLNHVEGYLELSAKTKTYFATAVSLWDAEFYVKVDDDIHVNLAALGTTLVRHRNKPRVYIGCTKSGPVLSKKGVKYHEPEYLRFGDEGNKYFRHATGQLYGISKDLATYILQNQDVLHKYANEDVSLGSWFVGLDVEQVDDKKLCCSTPPGCVGLTWGNREENSGTIFIDFSLISFEIPHGQKLVQARTSSRKETSRSCSHQGEISGQNSRDCGES
ncbi:putative beta-1,3-galactosyltransferase 2, partial [Cucurbita argyrosperma subsp. sororia]